MIIQKPQPRRLNYRRLGWILIPLLLGSLILYLVLSVDRDIHNTPINDVIFSCDLETGNDSQFVAGSFLFEGMDKRSHDFARSGRYSIALNKQQVYGLTTHFQPENKDVTYHLSVWRYNPEHIDSWLVVAAPNPKDLYVAQKESKETDSDGWEQLHISFQVPPNVDQVKLYCYAGGDGSHVYFDDMMLVSTDLGGIAEKYDMPAIDLTIDPRDLEKLRQKRDEAWENGLLIKSDDDWVKAKVGVDGEELKAKIRLKGDWLDHLKGTKWSFRVEIKEPYAFWGMKTLNLQKPETRGFLREWIYHEMLREQGILSPRYHFVLLTINDKVLGVYALEEHFEKELVESSLKREGPILKFAEDRFWSGVKRQFDALGKARFLLEDDKEDAYWSSEVTAFNESAILQNPVLQSQYERGAALLSRYRYGEDSLDQIFDVDLMGKYLAIIEICGAYHNLTWHNQRWYYNPLSDRLEPIGFDGFTDQPPVLNAGSTVLADDVYRAQKDVYEPFRKFFYDPAIAAAYIFYLDSLSDSGHMDAFWAERQGAISEFSMVFQEEYTEYQFDRSEYDKRCQSIQLTIPAHDRFSLMAIESGSNRLTLANKHHFPLQIQQDSGAQALVLYPGSRTNDHIEIANTYQGDIPYQVLGLDSTYYTPVSILPRESLSVNGHLRQSNQDQHPLCHIAGNDVILSSGQCNEPIVVGAGFRVVIPAGTEINFVNQSYLYSSSPLITHGTADNPVVIYSSDATGAVMVRKAEGRSQLENTQFRDLGTIFTDGLTLTGAVTFYESDVTIRSCQFLNCRQEDALNIIRSDFEVIGSGFVKTASDAFDADFCVGSVRDCIFRQTGNDAMDFSGSQVEITRCDLKNIGDKGVSVGEDSEVMIHSLAIEQAPIGVAAKDLSRLVIDQISMKRVNTGFTAYQKKSTFGPAEIEVRHYEVEQVDHLHIIETGSSLMLSGMEVTMK